MVTDFGQGEHVRYFCEDESRFGMKTLMSRVITLFGVKPIAPVQWSRQNFWLYGAVEPSSGEHFFYEFSHLDSICFQQFIDLFAAAFPDSLNLLHLDQASCHTATSLVWPENVLPIFQPAHSPELNPIERLWQDLKKHFKGRNFDNLAALRDEVFGLLNSLCPSTIMSLTGWSYILDALNLISTSSA
jgi:DDE superfamily endonuclease